ncbi:N-acetyltransferase [Virgibacillus halodenitrificans]|uniref:N-acetyltransferase n=2 Tax=Virgibacillus halodenitrificans TaxID=1482 RepID=UPI001F22E05C|nr:N-acetyltransferase [Virgibacillus halodenitrificans]WHX26642.1 N-acetyltransferase [Virgibacillus halodenitrificans]
MMETYLRPTPWDQRNFHIPTYELTSISEEALHQSNEHEGHFTLKIDPLANTELLNKYGFYYVDTLIEPVCHKSALKFTEKDGVELSYTYNKSEILRITAEAFQGGRFHRDYNIPNFMADKRYVNWVKDLIEENQIMALKYEGSTAGFYAYEGNKILLLGMDASYRGKGLAKPFLSKGASEHFSLIDEDELVTSISPSNLPSLNLFISTGFKLRNTVDVYHKLNGSLPVGG